MRRSRRAHDCLGQKGFEALVGKAGADATAEGARARRVEWQSLYIGMRSCGYNTDATEQERKPCTQVSSPKHMPP